MIKAVVFDLDGVLRHYGAYAPVEDAHGLPPGALAAAAFDASILDDAVLPARNALRSADQLVQELRDAGVRSA